MKLTNAIIITGANGLLGADITKKLAGLASSELRVFAVVRSRKAESELKQILGEASKRVEVLLGDLCEKDRFLEILPQGCFEHAVLVHCAADVSWDKSQDELTPVNIDGTRTAAQLLTSTAHKGSFVYISSAYTRAEDWNYRNGYEASKAAAERTLRSEFPDLPLSVFSCSLVVGRGSDGEIERFHGLYPLIRLISAPNTPFLIGRPDCMIDLVPIDWVTDELYSTIIRAIDGEQSDVVAANGNGAIRLDDMFRSIEAEVNLFRQQCGYSERPELPILSSRRWDFLKRSIQAWKPEKLSSLELRHITNLIEIYRPYTTSDQVRQPQQLSTVVPKAKDLIGPSTRYWLEKHSKQLIVRWQRNSEFVRSS